jgi:H+/Cl- antiporter ClcA
MSKSPANRVPITPSPQHSGSTVRKAFLIESLFNLGTIPLLTHTRPVLSLLLARPADINPSTILFARLFAGIIIGALTPALWFGTANTRTGIECRRPVYVILGGGELCLIPILIREALKHGDRTAALSEHGAWGVVSLLLPPFLWRIYTLFVRPDTMGRYDEKRE